MAYYNGERRACLYAAPFDVRLFAREERPEQVDPATLRVQVFLLEEGRFVASGVYGPEDRVKVAVLEDCYVDLGPVFLD